MVGVKTLYTIALTQISSEEVVSESNVAKVESNIDELPTSIAQTIYENHCIHELDSVDVQLDSVEYLEYDDLEKML